MQEKACKGMQDVGKPNHVRVRVLVEIVMAISLVK
jgi:hypothetical protein